MNLSRIFSFDIDGTISDYPEHWLKFLSFQTGLDFTSKSIAKTTLGLSLYDEYKTRWRMGPEYEIPIRNELLTLASAIYDAGGRVFINSRRPFDKFPEMKLKTMNWLKVNGFQFEDVGPKSLEAIVKQKADYHLDDELSEALRIASVPSISKVGLICRSHDIFLETLPEIRNSSKVKALKLEFLLQNFHL